MSDIALPTSNRNDHYHRIFDDAPVGMFIVSPEGSILDANRALAEMVGYSDRRSLKGASVEAFGVNDESALRCVERLQRDGEIRDIEIELGRPDGSSIWLSLSASAAHDDEGRITFYQGVVGDITERKQAEQVLVDSEARFSAFMNNSPVIAYIKDENGCFAYVNAVFERTFGKPLAEIEGATEFDLFPLEAACAIRRNDQQVLESDAPLEAVEEMPTHDGGARSWMTVKFPITDGSTRYVGGVGIDITERLRAELAEQESARRFRELFENSPDPIFVDDLHGIVLDVNSAACRLHGLERDALIGRNVLDLVPPDKRPGMSQVYPKLARGEMTRCEGDVLHSAGHTVPVSISASHVDYLGKPALLVHARDMTGQRQLQEQFLQAQKMEAVGRLAGGVAHDFNNLLTAIIGYNEMVLDGLDPATPLHRHSLEIQRAGERAANLVRQLLAFSRKQALEPTVLDVNAVIRDVGKMIRRLIGDDVEVVTEYGADVAAVKADRGQLEQVIINLVVNARDAMHEGGTLTIRTQNWCPDAALNPDVKPGDYAMISVSDTGTGMDEETRKHLFEPFFTTKGVGKGTGLGLATCYGIVEQSGGHITCHSELGAGATFDVCLPRSTDETEMLPLAPEKSALPSGSETVLVVEDEPGVRDLAGRVLRMLGYQVHEAVNGQEALTFLRKKSSPPIDLLLTDVMMPQMGGRKLAEQFRVMHPRTPVLFNSGVIEDDNQMIDDLVRAEGGAFLPKPFTPTELARKVREVLDESRARS